MALETPIVASDVDGTGELIANGVHGVLVPPDRAGDLTAGLRSVLADPGAAAARATSDRRRVESDLSFEQRVGKVEAIYDRMMGDCRIAQARRRPAAPPSGNAPDL